MMEQHNLRALIRTLKPSPVLPPQTAFILTPLLQELRQRIERLWNLRVNIRLDGLDLALPAAVLQGVYFIVQEALTNAARHAHATQADVELVVHNLEVRLTVRDNGRGFPFHGQYDLATLTALNLGPRMLRERVVSMGGTLVLDSTEAGTHLSITLPLVRSGG